MNYQELRQAAQTGDCLLVQGRGFWSWFIRVMTGETFTHVALLVWQNDGLWVAEMHERHGFRMVPASDWVPGMLKGAKVWYGKAPAVVRMNQLAVKNAALKFRGQPYAWWELAAVWVGRFFRMVRTGGRVCSTFLQSAWSAGGIDFYAPADPGDFFPLCQRVEPVTA